MTVQRWTVVVFVGLCLLECHAWNEWTWNGDGPGPRAGHSMVLINDAIFLFGGRSNDIPVQHVPRTYEVSEADGQLSFATYDQKLVSSCEGNVTFDECYNVTVGLLFNDMWSYDLGEPVSRFRFGRATLCRENGASCRGTATGTAPSCSALCRSNARYQQS